LAGSKSTSYICNVVEKKNLSYCQTYRYLIGAFLMSLYVFIAMPVQLWHKHSAKAYPSALTECQVINEATSGAEFTNDMLPNAKTVRAGAVCLDELQIAGDNADNCKMCSHHYSSYLENSACIVLINSTLLKIPYSSFRSSFPREEVLSFSNKGPPATI
jgi:hypothetical protein